MTEPMTEVGERAVGTTATGTDEEHAPEHLLTIPEAAARIGVSERTLYRLLKSENFAARTLTEHRQTVTGRRLTMLLPPDLMEEIGRRQPLPFSQSLSQGKAEGAEEGGRGGNGVNASKNADNDAANVDKNTSANADNTGETVSNDDADTVPPPGRGAGGNTAGHRLPGPDQGTGGHERRAARRQGAKVRPYGVGGRDVGMS